MVCRSVLPLHQFQAMHLVFENPQHDLPQVISYTKINAGCSLFGKISGIKNGKYIGNNFQ